MFLGDTPTSQRQRAAAVKDLTARGIHDQRVLDAIAEVPREFFVPGEHSAAEIYGDAPLPIGHGQTTTRLYSMALMLQAAELKPGEHVLDVGTGSGYQSAILSRVGVEVWTLETIPELSDEARETLRSVGCEHVHVLLGDGTKGYPPAGLFDAILVCAASTEIPSSLVLQLKLGGRLVVPVGDRTAQRLLKVTRRPQGMRVESLGECRFLSVLKPKASPTSALSSAS